MEHPSVPPPGGKAYPRLVLLVLVLIYILNFIDRQILSVIAESIKADLDISDADIGFLFGTAFAVFYSVMGIPLGQLADTWNRKRLIAIGLSVWSLMTVLSGFASNFATLALYRFGVGAGEASASPASYSILYDYFPPRVRTTVLSLYSAGNFIGQGLGIFLGGFLLALWLDWYPDALTAPLGLRPWQFAFLAVGLPGLAMALIVMRLREPERGVMDGIATPPPPYPVRDALLTLAGMIPLGASLRLAVLKASGRMQALNLLVGLLLGIAAWRLVVLTGSRVQWMALVFGLYAVVSWAQLLALRDRVGFRLIFGSPALLLTVCGVAATNFMISSVSFWSIPYYQRAFAVPVRDLGLVVGLIVALGGLLGVVAGGIVADMLRKYRADGKLLVVLFSLIASMAAATGLLLATELHHAYAASLGLAVFSAMGLGPAVSTVNDLVLPRVRASATAFGFMATYLIAGAIGPYLIGLLSDVFIAQGRSAGAGLREAMLWSLLIPCTGIVMVFAAVRRIGRDEGGLAGRARMMGETV